MATPKLTTAAACRVARIDRVRFNEHVTSGAFHCAPDTIPGRSRLFDPDDMLALRLFRDLIDDGLNSRRAGKIACSVAAAARENPGAAVIAYVQPYLGPGSSVTFERLMETSNGDLDSFYMSGSDVRDVRLFRVGKLRQMIAHYTEEERSIIGEDD